MHGRQEVSPDKVAVYIRWSTEDQGDGTTLDVQMEGCTHYLLSQGWRVRPELIFIDDGYSGATLNRPALNRLRELVSQGEVGCVVVYKLDRLSRSVADTARLCMDEWDGICYVKSAREPIDTNSQAGKMFFYTLMNYAEWERSVIKDRTHSGRVRRAQEGRNPGITLPYGYARDPGTGGFAVVPHEASVVRRIFEAYRLGAGLLTIANTLNTEGTPFRGGRKWQVNTITYMLSNRAYVGDLVWGLRMKNPRSGKLQGEKLILRRDEPLVERAGVFPAIVTREEFDLVQTIKQERPTVGRGGGRSLASAYLLTGFLRCGGCGRPMVGAHNDPRRKNGYYYCCITRRDQGKAVCPAPNIQCHLLDAQVVAKVMALYGTECARHQCLDTLARDARARADEARAELAEVERKLGRLAEKERRLAQDYNHDRLTVDEFRTLREALTADLASFKGAQQALTLKLKALEVTVRNEAFLAAEVDRLQVWDDLTVPQRKHLLRQFVEQVTAFRDQQGLTCEVTWKLRGLTPPPGD